MRSKGYLDATAPHLLALAYQERQPDGSPSMSARIGAMHLAEFFDNLRALRIAWAKTK
jgi:hypothetical protein